MPSLYRGRSAAVFAAALFAIGASAVGAAPDHPYTRAQDSTRVVESEPAVTPSEAKPPVTKPPPPTSSPIQGLLSGRVDEIFIVLVPARSDIDITADLERARDIQSMAERVLADARSNEARAKAQIDIQKSTIDHLKSKGKLAKEEQRDGDRLDLERKRDMEELVLKVFQRQRELRATEKDYAEALRDHAKQAIETYQVELRLFEARADREALAGTTDLTRLSTMERRVRALEADALEVMKDLADKDAKQARVRKAIMERRQKVFEAQRDIRTAELG
jgi:hypothetical protein